MKRNPLRGRGVDGFSGFFGGSGKRRVSRKRNAFKLEALEQRALMAVAPVLADDAYMLDEDTSITIPADQGLLANDTDADGDTLTVTGAERTFFFNIDDIDLNSGLPAVDLSNSRIRGTLVVNPDGSFTYTPNANGNGIERFEYTVIDGTGNTSTAFVSFTVRSINDAPVANDDYYTVNEDEVLGVFTFPDRLIDNDNDADNYMMTLTTVPVYGPDRLTITLLTQPSHGTATLTPSVGLIYTPDPNFHGVDTFEYTITDESGASDVGLVTITVNPVNDAIVAVDDEYEVDEDGSITVPASQGVLENDSNPDGVILTAALTENPDAGVPLIIGGGRGTLVMNADGSFTYTPAANNYGEETFWYTVSDGAGGTSVGKITFKIRAIADAPVAQDDYFALNRDTPLFSNDRSVLANDRDPDELFLIDPAVAYYPFRAYRGTLTAALATPPTHGAIEFNSDGTFVYRPNEGYFGDDSFTYTVTDMGGQTSTATVYLQVAQASGEIVDGEVIGRNGTNEQFVKNLYEDLLDRAIDQAGFDYHLGMLTDGASREAVAQSILVSQEYVEKLVNSFYLAFLNRSADDAGLTFYRNALQSGAMSEQQVAADILGSAEFFNLSGGTHAGFVSALYDKLLGRAADEEGMTNYSRLLAAGVSREDIAADIVASNEFIDLLLDDPLPLPTEPQVTGNRFAPLEGWYQDYLREFGWGGTQYVGKDEFFAKLADGELWRDVQAEMLALEAYFQRPFFF